jgi:hypothetical protein
MSSKASLAEYEALFEDAEALAVMPPELHGLRKLVLSAEGWAESAAHALEAGSFSLKRLRDLLAAGERLPMAIPEVRCGAGLVILHPTLHRNVLATSPTLNTALRSRVHKIFSHESWHQALCGLLELDDYRWRSFGSVGLSFVLVPASATVP